MTNKRIVRIQRKVDPVFCEPSKNTNEMSEIFMASKLNPIRHCRNEKGAGAEMRPAIVSGIVTRARQSTIGQFFHSPGNSPRSLCESKPDPVSPRFLNSRENGYKLWVQ